MEDGKIGIGSIFEDPRDTLDIHGEVLVSSCVKQQNGLPIAGICLSDERLKRNIAPFEPALEKVVQLRPVHFDYRADEYPDLSLTRERAYGLIAQEVEKILPEMVKDDPRGFKAVNYSELPMFLLQAVRELKAENEELRKRLQTELQEI
jgi:hypothetical protein